MSQEYTENQQQEKVLKAAGAGQERSNNVERCGTDLHLLTQTRYR